METTDANLNWEWQDELLATLDAESPLGTAHTLWADLNQSEGGMLETTPASKFSGGDHDLAWEVEEAKQNSLDELILEDSPLIKRRRMLQFESEENVGLFGCNSSLETSPFSSLENYKEIYGDDTQMFEPISTSSMWFKNNVGDNVNMGRSNDGRALGESLTKRECKPKQFLERETRQNFPVIIESGLCRIKSNEIESSGGDKTISGRSISSTKIATPVAYPFTVVKPSGIQGDVTLNDINKRIMMVRDELGGNRQNGASTETCESKGDEAFTSNSLAKSVVAFTKIHTEGNGSITIMRTKN